MKKVFDNIVDAGFEKWALFIFGSFMSALSVMGVIALCSDHMVRCYYMKSLVSKSHIHYTIKGDIDWFKDVTVFASNNADEVLKAISTMNQCSVDENNS